MYALCSVGLVWIRVFRKEWAPVTSLFYALMQGVVVGSVSVAMDRRYPGIALQAVGLTIAMSLSLLAAYRFGIIRVTESFKKKLAFATSGVSEVYGVVCCAGTSRDFALALCGDARSSGEEPEGELTIGPGGRWPGQKL
jgi:uncharacterized YccA/Bax inhibitor family protein